MLGFRERLQVEFVLENLAVDETKYKGPIILGRCVGPREWVLEWQSHRGKNEADFSPHILL